MKAKKLPVGLRILFGFLSVILCVALFATSVLAIVLADARSLTSEAALKEIVHYVMFGSNAKKNAPAVLPQAVGGMYLEEDSNGGLAGIQQEIISTLYEIFSEQFGEEVPFTEKEVEQLLEQSTLPEFISEKVAGIMTDIYTGDVKTTVTGAEIMEQLELNADLIQDTLGFELPEEYKDKIVEWVEQQNVVDMVQNLVLGNTGAYPEDDVLGDSTDASAGDRYEGGHGKQNEIFADGVISGLLSGEGTVDDVMNGGITVILQALREVTSVELLLIVLGACLLLIGLLCLVNLKQIHVAVRCVGITLMVAALPFAVATVLAFAVPSLFEGDILPLAHLALTLTAGVQFGVFAGGLVILVVSCLLTARFKKNLVTPLQKPVEAVPATPDLPAWNAPMAEEAPAAAEAAEEVAVEENLPMMEESPAQEELPVMEEEPSEEAPQEV